MGFTSGNKVAGEMAVRQMSEKAQKWYGGQDWMTIYAVDEYLTDEDLPEYGATVINGKITIYYTEADGEIEAFEDIHELESILEAYEEENENPDWYID